MDFLAQLWSRVTTPQPPPDPSVSLVIAGIALAAVLLVWRQVRMLVTVCHEGGHASVAVLVGRRVSGVRLHADTSGLTLSRGRDRGPGMVATLFAGYPAASVIGLGVAWLTACGRAVGALALLVLLLVLLLVRLRNFYGLLIVLATVTAVGAATWFASPQLASWLTSGVAWLLLLAGPRPVVELMAGRRSGSDAEQLAQLTRVPQAIWILIWLALCVAAAVFGADLLLGGALGRSFH